MLRTSLLQYAEDYSDTLPPMRGQAQLHEALWPYTRSEGGFHDDEDASHLYLPNSNLSRRKLKDLHKLTVALYESEPAKSDGARWVAFLPDSSPFSPASPGFTVIADPDFRGLALVKEAAWQRLKVANGIP